MKKSLKNDNLVYSGLSLDLLYALRQISSKPKFAGFDSLIQMTKPYKNDTIIESVIKGIDARNKSFANATDLANALSAQTKTIQNAIKGISFSFQDLAKNQQLLSGKLLLACNSQLALSSSINALTKAIQPNIYKNFNALSVTMEAFTKSYLDLTIKSKEWENLDIFQQTTDKIKIAADELVTQDKTITIEDLNNFKTEIIEELSSTIRKTNNVKIIDLILKIITIITFVLQLQSINFSRKDITNKEVLEFTENDFTILKADIKDLVKQEFKELQVTRVAISDVNLRKSPNIKSKSLGILRKGQEIFLLEIRTKWLFITYIDKETNETKSGYVYEIYFKPTK